MEKAFLTARQPCRNKPPTILQMVERMPGDFSLGEADGPAMGSRELLDEKFLIASLSCVEHLLKASLAERMASSALREELRADEVSLLEGFAEATPDGLLGAAVVEVVVEVGILEEVGVRIGNLLNYRVNGIAFRV